MNATFTPVSAIAEIRNLEEINSAECIRAIDSLLLNGFTEKDKSLSEAFLTFWKPTEPQMFGDDLHSNLEFVGFELMPIELIESYQEHRAGSENKKLKNIKSSIASNGYKLKYIPPAVIIGAKGVVDHIITGNTRIKILKELGVSNVLIARYKFKGNPSNAKKREALLISGQAFNTHHDPNSPPDPMDIKRALTNLIKLFKDSKGEAGVSEHDEEGLRDVVNRMCGKGVLTGIRPKIVQEVRNEFESIDTVIPWGEDKSNKYRISVYMKDYKLVNTDNIIYFAAASNSSAKAMRKANRLAAANPDKEIRIVLHTSVLEGYNYEETYNNRLRKFVREFEDYRLEDSRGMTEWLKGHKEQIKIYAALPALGAYHNIDKPFFFNLRDMTAYQRDEDYTIDLEDSEE